MTFRQLLWWVTLCVCVVAAPLEARNLFVMPSGGVNTTYVYSADPFLSGGSFAYSPASFLSLSMPTGTKYYIVARATTDTIIVANSGFTPMLRIPLAQVAEAAALTPDGNRLLVVAGSALHIFSTATDTELATVDVAGPATDLAVALDSSRAFVISPYLQRLTVVDLTTNAVVGANSLSTAPTAVAVGPNGLVYVSADNRILEIDGRTMTVTSSPSGEIPVAGRPGKLAFTPDGNFALAPNLLASSTATLGMRLDLRTHTVTNLPQTGFFSGVTLNRIVVVSASRAFAISQGQKLYEISVDPLNIDESFLRGANNTGVTAMTPSNEVPSARFLFVAAAQNVVYRFDIAINQVNGTQGPLPFAPGSLAFAGAASTGPVAGVLQYNSAQSVAQGGTSLPLIVRVADAFTRPVYGAPVAFSTTAAGVTILNPNTVTGLDGFAQTAVNVFGATTATVPVIATIAGGQAYATFYLTVGGVTPGVGTGMQIVSGNGQVVPAAFPTAMKPLVVKVTDQAGAPVPGMGVSWQVSLGVALLSSTSTITDDTGQSYIMVVGSSSNIIPPFAQAIITATSFSGSVNFYLTVLANIAGSPVQPIVQILNPTDNRVSGRAGETLPDAIRVGVVTPTGVPVPNVGMEVTGSLDPTVGPVARCSATNILTDSNGFAKCDLVFGRTSGEGTLQLNVGNVRTQTISFEVTPGVPAGMRIVQGDGQSGNPGQRLPVPLVVEVTDLVGNILPGVTVGWEFGAEGTGARLTDVTTSTDSLGRASATVTLGPRPGDLVVRVRAVSAPGVLATFTLRANVTLGAIVKISGDNQTALTGQAFGSALVVEARDDQGRPVPNQTVTFTVTGSATLSASSATANAQGRAQITVQAGSTAGAITVTATAGSFSVTFSLTSRLPGPSITAASFLNGASFQQGLVPGGITTIVGAGLATGIQGCIGSGTIAGPLPLRLGGVEVLFGVTAAPIYSVCNVNGQEQVTVQAPFDLAPGGAVYVTVKVGGGQTTVSGVPVVVALPGIFETVAADGTRYGVATRPDGTLVTPSNPARRGELIRFYATSLGPTLPLVQTNQPGVGGQLAYLPVIVGLAGSGVPVVSAEYAQNMIGVFVVAFQIPDNAPTGREVTLSMGVVVAVGQPLAYSNTVKIAIQ